MPAIVWCTNFSDTSPRHHSCCMSSIGVERAGSLQKGKMIEALGWLVQQQSKINGQNGLVKPLTIPAPTPLQCSSECTEFCTEQAASSLLSCMAESGL